MTDPYAVLGVAPTATADEITRAYRRQLRTHHPDVRSEASPGTDDRLREILSAYALLRDPGRRAAYDNRADRVRAHGQPIRVTVSRGESAGEQPPLRAGPVRWHRRG
ncbi:MAG TPA: J domain-containing protein [Mycobacterium sp.]|nr:J domain-containing protein [Mycobacterium sp.]